MSETIRSYCSILGSRLPCASRTVHGRSTASCIVLAFVLSILHATSRPLQAQIMRQPGERTAALATRLAPIVNARSVASPVTNLGRPGVGQVAARRSVAAVVCAPVMLPVLDEWAALRRQQGVDMLHVDNRLPTPEIRKQLQQIARQRSLRFVVLVGDADAQMAQDQVLRAMSVPTFYYEATAIKRWGPETVIATDNPYGDLDGDGVPEIAVGRLTADTPAELQQIVNKIIRYEQLPSNGTWRRRINMTAGVGDFGAITDALVETAAKRFVTEGMPAEYRVNLAYASWRSPYCPDPYLFRNSVLGALHEGCLFWIYMGHGRPYRLDRIRHDETVLPILEASDVDRMSSANGLPIAIMMACYTGAFDQPMDCLAEQMLRAPGGPVSVICGSRVTMPYAMAILGTALMDAYFDERCPTLGEALLHAKQELASEHGSKPSQRKLLDTMARALSPGKDELAAERAEHQLLFHLLGDPTLRLRQPAEVQLECASSVDAGGRLQIKGVAPIGGQCLVELCCRRDGFTFEPSRRRRPGSDEGELAEMTETYRRANNRLWELRQLEVKSGPFAIDLPVPDHARGFSHARVFIQNTNEYAMGSSPVYIKNANQQSELRHSNADR